MLTLEKTVSKDIQDNIRRELTPYLGLHNFQISVAAKLNTDNRQTNETIYNPDSRVERSTRVVKENNTVNNSTSQAPTSVASAVPQDKPAASTGDAKNSTTDNSKREELTNYELSSKVVTTVSGGYGIDHLSIAVLVNRAALANPKGGTVAAQLADIEALIDSAAGLRKERGDTIKVLAADFAEAGHDLDPIPSPGIVDVLMRQSGTAINALAVVVVAVLLIVFGIRPLTRVLRPAEDTAAMAFAAADPMPALEAPPMDMALGPQIIEAQPEANLIEDVTSRPRRSPQRRLEQMVEFDEDQARNDPQAMGRTREPRLMHAPLARHLVRFARPPAGASAVPPVSELAPDAPEPMVTMTVAAFEAQLDAAREALRMSLSAAHALERDQADIAHVEALAGAVAAAAARRDAEEAAALAAQIASAAQALRDDFADQLAREPATAARRSGRGAYHRRPRRDRRAGARRPRSSLR